MSSPTMNPEKRNAIQYQLDIIGGFSTLFERDGEIEAILKSPLLDEQLHPGHVSKVLIHTQLPKGFERPCFMLDSFIIDSLCAYLTEQQNVRQIIEAGLRRELPAFGLTESDWLDGSMWSKVRVVEVSFRPKDVLTAERLGKTQEIMYPDESLEDVAAKFDTADTRSAYMIILTVDWDDEHQRWIYFRDEKLTEFSAC